MKIVVKQTNDSETAYDIAKSLSQYFDEKGLEKIRKETKTQIMFGAYVDEKMIGFVTYKELNPQAIEMTWLAVSPEYQKQGVGSELVAKSLKKMEAKYKVCEVKTLSDVHPDSGYARTRKFYKKLGFIPIETIHPYPGWEKDDPCQIFVKFLR